MDNLFKIKLNYKKNYSYGIYHAGFDLFCYLFIENTENRSFSALDVRVTTAPNILLSGSCQIPYVAPLASKAICCDFIHIDHSRILSLKSICDVSVTVQIFSDEGEELSRASFPLKLLPYQYFSGLNDMPETLSFFVTPDQEELNEIEPKGPFSDAVDLAHQLYDKLKEKKITFSSEDYSGTIALPVRLPEKVLRDRFANPMELAILFDSVLEKHRLSPILAFLGKGKVYCGFSLKEKPMQLLSTLTKSRKNLDDLYLIDAAFLAYGSELDFDSALFDTKNSLQLCDETITVLDIKKARNMHLISLPNRISDGGNFILDDKQKGSAHGGFSEYYSLLQEYRSNEKISSILTGSKLQVKGHKGQLAFNQELDVNQNKILGKIINNDFTLIRAQSGAGASTVLSHAASTSLKSNKSVLYITDNNYHSEEFVHLASKLFDRSFILDLIRHKDRLYQKSDFEGIFLDHSSIFDAKDNLDTTLNFIDEYYAHLEGEKKIVSSFLTASDRYHQLKDAEDVIIFSPEQVGMLSDEMVQTWFSSVNEIVKIFSEIGVLSENPLKLVRQRNFSYEFKSKLIRQLEDILRSIESISALRDQIATFFPSLGGLRSFQIFFAFQDLMRLFSEFYAVPERFFEQPDRIDEHFRKVTSLIQAKNENDSIVKTIRISFEREIFELDAIDLFQRYQALSLDKSLKALTLKRGIFKTIKKYLRPNCDVENVEYILSRLNAYHQNVAFIQAERDEVFRLLSVPYLESDASWSALQFAADLCYQCFSIFQGLSIPEKLPEFVSDFKVYADVPGISDKITQLRFLAEEFSDIKNELSITVGNQIDYFYAIATGRDQDYFSYIYTELSSVLAAADHLKSWCQWLSVREKAIGNGLKNIVSSIENGKISHEGLKRSFLRAFFKAVCEYNFITHPELVPESFSFDEKRLDYKKYRSEYLSQKKGEANSILSMNRFDGLTHLDDLPFSFDLLLESDSDAFKKIFPCIVCDMDTAKNLFSKKASFFDYIFVESRARLPISDFLWVFSCGKHVTLAGGFSYCFKERGTFFDLSVNTFDYLWSITEEKYSLSASYRGEPALTQLKSEYYSGIRPDARVYSVPSAKVLPAVDFRSVNGFYDTEFPFANHEEAELAVDLLVDFAMREEGDSIAIIASTDRQKKLILRFLAQRLRSREELTEKFQDFSRFIILSVHDEIPLCDHVIFSATYAPNRSIHGGRLPFSFFEFAPEDPRLSILNVLSSAKKSLVILSSFSADDLRFTESVLPTPSAFSLLYDLANVQQSSNCTFSVSSAIEISSIVKKAAIFLEKKGYKTVLGIQSGRFFIDLGIANEENDFLMGVLSDHTVLNQQSNIAAIEYANEELFDKNGWKLFRLRSTSCFDSFEGEMERLLSALEPEEEVSVGIL